MKKVLLLIIIAISLLNLNGYTQTLSYSVYEHPYECGVKYIVLFSNGRFYYVDIPEILIADYIYKGHGEYQIKEGCVSFRDDRDAELLDSRECFINDADSVSLIFYSFNDQSKEFECRNYFTQIIINSQDTFSVEFGKCKNLCYGSPVYTIDFFFPPHTMLRYNSIDSTNTNFIELYFNYSFDYNRVYLENMHASTSQTGEYMALNDEEFVKLDSLPDYLQSDIIMGANCIEKTELDKNLFRQKQTTEGQ